MAEYLQGIIGTDKRNPFFSVFRDCKNKQLHVFYGCNIFEVLPDDTNSVRMKILVGRLYNARIRPTVLSKEFGYCYRTIKRYGEAINSSNAEDLVKAIEGNSYPRKLTDEIIGFASYEFKRIYPENRRNYSQTIRDNIKEVFKVELSSESLRPLFGKLRKELDRDTTKVLKKTSH